MGTVGDVDKFDEDVWAWDKYPSLCTFLLPTCYESGEKYV